MTEQHSMCSELKRRLTSASSFEDTANYFLDEVSHLPEMKRSQNIDHDRVEMAVRVAWKQLVVSEMKILRLQRLPETSLVHGTATGREAMAAFFYFDDDDVGLLALSRFMVPHETTFARLTAFALN
ncbi:MAG: hypothetical protein AAF449_11125 [Myxococcota bacterium]